MFDNLQMEKGSSAGTLLPSSSPSTDPTTTEQTETPRPILTPLTLSDLPDDYRPPEREWIVQDFIPAGAVTSMYGQGGTGKTLLALQLMASIATGQRFLDLKTSQGKVMGLFCEDDQDEILRRLCAVCQGLGVKPKALDGKMVLLPPPNGSSLLFDKKEKTLTETGDMLLKLAREHKPALLVVDNIASTFDGNEIDRSDVMQYLNGVALRLANEIGCAVVLLGHPAMGEKRIHSGSTAWLNGVRSSLVLKACSGGGLELCLTKSNYARPGQRIGMDFSATDYGPPFLVRDDSVLENDESDERTGSTKEDILMRILEEAMPDGLRHKDWLEKAEKEGIKAGTAKDLISKMSKKGKARKEDGVYRAPSQTSNVFRFEDLDLSRVAA